MKTRSAKAKKTATHIYLRLPEDMHADISAVAASQSRSLNSLLVEILSEKLSVYRMIKTVTDKDPLAAAYMAANTIEEYVNAIRASILMKKMRDGDIEVNEETYPGLAAFAPDAMPTPAPIKPSDPLTADERWLSTAFKKLSPEVQLALITLIERG
ncbi:MAG: Arc family DNA-binding protein [Pseudomonadota bacterium]